MKKAKLFGMVGLAGILSVASVGCSNKQTDEKDNKAPMTENAQKSRIHGNREDISVSHIQRSKDYVKSVNCLLSLYEKVIPLVEKNASQMGIGPALHQAYAQCRKDGELKKDSVAYNFDDLVSMNYSGDDVKSWKVAFEKAGKEAKKILSEGDASSRRYVPKTTTGKPFLRREIVETNEITWKTAEEYEAQHAIFEQAKKYYSEQR